jgi:hypothetical protein
MRGRAMLMPLLKAQAASMGLAFAEPLLHPPLSVLAADAGTFLSWGSLAGFVVLTAWNLLHPDREGREERLEAALERQRLIPGHAGQGAGRTPWAEAVTAARRAGTFSLNGVRQPGTTLRYQGPPPVYTPPGGLEVMITVELRAEPQVARRLVSSNACRHCGSKDGAYPSGSRMSLCLDCGASR